LAKSYWDYYRADYEWQDQGMFPIDMKASEEAFSKAGFSDAQVRDLVSSGYVVESGLVIDRFYGGRLLSSDLRSRMKLDHFVGEPFAQSHPALVYHATSMQDVLDCLVKWRQLSSLRLLFRGQNCSYPLKRARPNPAYVINGFGEMSLLPSLWRKMLASGHVGCENFRNLSPFEWSKILYHNFDIGEVEARQEEALRRGEWMYSAQDMEDSDDPVLRAFGKQRLDVMMGLETNLLAQIQTLLQHYGLLSPLLDLTADLDVAMFFATHKFVNDESTGACTYQQIGTNNRQSVLYVIREDPNEMLEHQHHRALETIRPQRPIRQSCVVSFGGSDALNLPLEFLFGVIVLDFDDLPPSKYSIHDLFPGPNEDQFLAALIKNLQFPRFVSTF
jgi:hypothetical protein